MKHSAGVAILCAFLVLAMSPVNAGTARVGPDDDYDEIQRIEYYVGLYSVIMKLCGYNTEAKSLRTLSALSPIAKDSRREMSKFDEYRGNCTEARTDAEYLLDREQSIRAILEDKY